MIKKSDILEIKQILSDVLGEVYGFPNHVSTKQKRFVDKAANRLYERFRKGGKKQSK